MFNTGIRVISRCTSLYRRDRNVGMETDRPTNQNAPGQDLPGLICRVLADMLPATAEEIACSVDREPALVAACLEELACGYRVMFNPLTKRFSLPKAHPGSGIAA